ncbi:unnamed protein product, partial [Rotaria sp. Silwood2]
MDTIDQAIETIDLALFKTGNIYYSAVKAFGLSRQK